MKRLLLPLLFASSLGAQELGFALLPGQLAERGPRFLLATRAKREPVPLDVLRTTALKRKLTIDLVDVSTRDAIKIIARESGLEIAFSDQLVPAGGRVNFRASGITVASALTEVLLDAQLDVVFTEFGTAALVKRPEGVAPPVVGTITGTVTEAATGSPVPQVQVSVSGTSLRRITDESGRYMIAGVAAGMRTVTVRRLGYDPQSREVNVIDGQSVTADFALVGAATRLAEVVTTVTGGQRRMEMGSAIATVSADSLTQIAPVMSFGDLLQGRAPGVFSMQESGMTGQAGRIRIRGLNSTFVSNDPIVMIDGVRVEASAGRSATIATSPAAAAGTGRLSDLNPAEIESVEIVKGPSAATLYGTDAANGVVVITTKRGKQGRTRLTAFTEQGSVAQNLSEFPDAYYAFGRNTATNAPQRCTLLQRAAGSCVADSLASFNTMTNPATRPFKDSWRHQYGLQLSGGTSGSSYYVSGDYEQEDGTFFMPIADEALIMTTQGRDLPDWQRRPNVYQKVNVRGNVTVPMGQRGNATVSTGFVSSEARNPELFSTAAQVGYRDANDGWRAVGTFNSRPAYQFVSTNQEASRRFIGSLAANYAVSSWLAVRGTLGADLSGTNYARMTRRGEAFPGAFNSTGQRSTNALDIARYSVDAGATATHTLTPTINSNTSVGVQYNRRTQRGAFSFVNNLPLAGETVAGGTLLQTGEATLGTVVAGGYIEEVVGLRERLFITGAVRFDGGSAFGEDFSVAAYPKAGVSWVVTDGDAGARLTGVSALRLRAAYGASGVQPGPTDALSQIRVDNGFNVAGTASGPVGTLVAGNVDLKPERSSEAEAGLDLELWESRVRLDFTAYHRVSSDALIRRPLGPDVAVTLGGTVVENLGSVRNRGLEVLLSADLLRSRTLAAGFTATGALNKNTLRRLGEGVAPSSPTSESTRLEEGYPIFGLWGRAIESFADANGNGIIEASEIVVSTTSRFVGPLFPGREATVAPHLRLFGEQLHLSGLLQYRGDHFRRDVLAQGLCQTATASCRAQNDLATPLAEQARAVAGAVLGSAGPFMKDGSYWLLRELSLGLTVPSRVTQALRVQGGQVVLAGRNLALLSRASDLPFESLLSSSGDGGGEAQFAGLGPGAQTYWLLRLHLNF